MLDSSLTLEVRWFSLGEPPLAVEKWFHSRCPGELIGSAQRQDSYLCVPQYEYLNIKLRQGKLELKWRQEALGEWQFAHLVGKVERWQKWRCEDSRQQDLLPRGTQTGWVEVTKARSQRQHQGVTSELTQLTVHERDWWSLAFETRGNRLESFQRAVSQSLQSYPGPHLASDCSCAYPQWLTWH